MSYGSASHAKAAAPKRQRREGGLVPHQLRPGEPHEGGVKPRSPGLSRLIAEIAIPRAADGLQKLRRYPSAHRKSDGLKDVRSGTWIAFAASMAGDKRFVYVVKSVDANQHFYVGVTSDVEKRLEAHNAGGCAHTASRRPWKIHVVIEFSSEALALRFERYLKSASGRAFARRHFDSGGRVLT